MASFGGTTQKCKACEKTVYLVDELTADGKVYHKACFRCHHCKSTLKLHNYSSFEGVLYCKPHFDQLFKMTGSLDKSFEAAPRVVRDRSSEQGQTNIKVSSMFGGTQEKCVSCKKTVYPIEKVAVDGDSYHKGCFRCCHGGCVISPSNYVAHEHLLYCRHHHSQLFKQKGNFSQLTTQHHANGVFNGNNNGVTNGVANGASNGTTNGITNGLANGASNGTTNEITKAVAGASSGTTSEVTNAVANGASNGTTNEVTKVVANGASNVVSNGDPNGVTHGDTNGVADGVTENTVA